MKKLTYLLLSILVVLFSLTSCSSDKPEPTSTWVNPTNVPDPTPVSSVTPPTSSSISLRLVEVELVGSMWEDHTLYLDNITLVPLQASGQNANASFQYFEQDQQIGLTYQNSYVPSTDWYIAIDRDDLGDSFGMWFVFSGAPVDADPSVKQQFQGFLHDAAPFVEMAISLIPGGSTSIKGTKTFLGFLSVQGVRLTRQAGQEQISDLIQDLTNSMYEQGYISEAFVFLDETDNYHINHELEVLSSDGAIRFTFQVVETGTELSENPEIIQVPQLECGDRTLDNITSGMLVTVNGDRTVFDTPLDGGNSLFVLEDGSEVETIVPYCDGEIVWWRVRNQSNETGWVQEAINGQTHLDVGQ
jgi:hypothetical protein